MAVTKVGRVMVPVTDQDKAIEFYVDKLGFEVTADVPFGNGDRWVEVTPSNGGAAIALVIPQPADERSKVIDQYDLGQATYAIMVTAADLGIGTGHSSVGDQEKAREILGVPAGHDVAYLIGVGYPDDRPLKPISKPNRRPFDEVVRHGHW